MFCEVEQLLDFESILLPKSFLNRLFVCLFRFVYTLIIPQDYIVFTHIFKDFEINMIFNSFLNVLIIDLSITI